MGLRLGTQRSKIRGVSAVGTTSFWGVDHLLSLGYVANLLSLHFDKELSEKGFGTCHKYSNQTTNQLRLCFSNCIRQRTEYRVQRERDGEGSERDVDN